MHHAPLPGLLAPEQGGHDAGVEGDTRGMIAHAGQPLGGRRAPFAHQFHQTAARPVGQLVEALAVALGAVFAVGGERGVDHPGV